LATSEHASSSDHAPAKREASKSTAVEPTKQQNQPQNKSQSGSLAQDAHAPPSFVFEKEFFDRDGQSGNNGLSELSKTLGERKSNVVRKAEMVVIVFTPSRHRLKIRVEKSATVEEVVRGTLQQYHMEGLAPPLSAPSDNYYLMMAEEDGTPDREVPQLNPRHLIQRYGNTFCLQEVGKPVISHRSSSQTVKPVFTIHLPNNERNTVKYQQNMRLSDLLKNLCSKRNMNPNDYFFHKVGSSTPVRLDIGLQDLGVNEIMLGKKS